MSTYSNNVTRVLNGGYYKYLDCNGTYTLLGDIHCDRFLTRGLIHSSYSLNAQIIDGSGNVNVRRGIRCSTATWSGFSVVHSPMQVTGQLIIRGRFFSQGECVAGAVDIDGYASIENLLTTDRLIASADLLTGPINAKEASVVFTNRSRITSLKGRHIIIHRRSVGALASLFLSRSSDTENVLTVTTGIVGNDIDIDHVVTPSVVGVNVVIGPGCRIKNVRYRDSIYIDSAAVVDWYEPYDDAPQQPNNPGR